MTLFVCFVKSIGRVYTSTLASFSEIFLAVNQRELSPAPAIPGGGGFINPYINDAGAAGANSTFKPKEMKKSLRLLYAGVMMTLLMFIWTGINAQNA